MLRKPRKRSKASRRSTPPPGLDEFLIRREKVKHVPKWTRERVLETLRRLEREGKFPSAQRVCKDGTGLYSAAWRHVGSWEDALRAAGIDCDKYRVRRRPRTREGIGSELRAWVKRNGPLCHARLDKSDPSLLRRARWMFGTVGRASLEFGLPYEPACHPYWTRDSILDALCLRIRDEKSLGCAPVSSEDGGLYKASRRYWGSWKAVRAAAEAAFRSGGHGGARGEKSGRHR